MIERFVPGAGGVENVAWQVAHELVRQGEDVTVLAREGPAEGLARAIGSDDPARRPGDRAPQLEALSIPRFWQPLRVNLFSRATRRATAGVRFDVVHSFARTRHQDLYRAGGGRHRDYLERTHTGLGLAARQLSPRHRTLLAIERGVFADARQRIQCASRLVADALVEREGVDRRRILLLPNAVDAGAFTDRQAVEAGRRLRARLDPEARRIWLFAGSGWRRKGLATALEAIALLRDPDVRLWIAGRDDPAGWRARVDSLGLASRVRFLGECDGLHSIFPAVDGLLLPTRYDPFANVTLEAAAAGLPCVTSSGNGAAEWLTDAVRVVARADDAPAYARALALLAPASERRALGEQARARARRLDWPAHVGALRAEYARIVGARRLREAA